MSMALYRTYRPGALAEVIGQDHVTIPLARALDTGRAHHAYLFTGPRGCGKTSSARILARSLNCVEGPTSTPCGVCQSCTDLAPNGPGSLDVVELDAATHGLVDDARDLREKAMYAPASSRFKVYIIDEAHQLGPGAANALLKLIEEPPPHLRFVFATTEPDKILATIRSRTHHYPFRLVSARRLQEHLAWVCEQEGVPAEAAALALVARAAAGSVRDSQSILGQLVAGSGPEGLTYVDAVAQLGFTDATLLDEVVDALIADDGGALFSVVDRVVEGGLDPRRFATDLLERFRDLIVLTQVPDAAEAGLLDAPDDQLDTLRRQGAGLGPGQLSRSADLVSAGLSELKGTTAPRLQLELLCARLLLPTVDDSEAGVLARLDRVERRIAYVGQASAAVIDVQAAELAAVRATTPAPETPARETPARETPAPETPAAPGSPADPPTAPAVAPARTPVAPPKDPGRKGSGPPAPPKLSDVAVPPPAPSQLAEDEAPAVRASPAAEVAEIKARWADVLEALRSRSRVAHTLADGSSPIALHDSTLVVAHPDKIRMAILRQNDGHMNALALATKDVLGLDVVVDFVLDASAGARSPAPPATAPPAVVPPAPAPSAAVTQVAVSPAAAAPPTAPTPPRESPPPRAAAVPKVPVTATPAVPDPQDGAAPEDLEIEASDLSPLALVQRELGGSLLEEYDRP